MSKLSFSTSPAAALKGASIHVFLAPQRLFAQGWLDKVAGPHAPQAFLRAAAGAEAGTSATLVTSVAGDQGQLRMVAAVLPDRVSRHNSPSRADAIRDAIGRAGIRSQKKTAIILGLDDPAHYLAAANGAAGRLPLFTRKKGRKLVQGQIRMAASDAVGRPIPASVQVKETVTASRWAAWCVDMPPEDMTTAVFAREARKLVRGLPRVTSRAIIGPELLRAKLAGIHGVGRAAVVPPRLLILKYTHPGAKRTIALVGKGVIYDTGGLSLKIGGNMCTMKGDMGGGAAAAGAFRALAASGCRDSIVALIPLAENAIGPKSYRNDDILTMHSGRTVEINNTDAEGRLLLADAVSYAARKFKPDVIMDAATLTGAQLISTGLRHAAIVSNRQGIEERAVATGRSSGDLVHPLPFAPEFFQKEFASKFADMRNSVANRSNAQSSCAAQFVYAHIEDLDPPWLHIDLAGPAWRDGRGTGYGVALMSQLARALKAGDLRE